MEWEGRSNLIRSAVLSLLPEVQEDTPCGFCTVNPDFYLPLWGKVPTLPHTLVCIQTGYTFTC